MEKQKSRGRLYDRSEHAEIVAKIRALYDQGYTVKEVAGILGYAPGTVRRYAPRVGFRPMQKSSCVYPNIRKWLNKNETMRRTLQQWLGMRQRSTLHLHLNGTIQWKEKHIKILIEKTGMSREELLKMEKPWERDE